MPSPSPPRAPAVQALASQVGGHAGVMTTEDGSLLIKPAAAGELAFYELLKAANKKTGANLVKLREFTPEYLGTLRLEGRVEPGSEDAGALKIQPVGDRTESLVLKNLSYNFSKANVLDAKLGRVLYDHEANAEKVKRMRETARETTSWKSGLRLTGFQVHDNNTGKAVNTPKAYGKSIGVSDLPDGIAQFFPIANPNNNGETNMGLPAQTLLPMLQGIRHEIAQIKAALKDVNLRMVGGSILIVYEADWKKAEEGLQRYMKARGGSVTEEGYEEFDVAECEKVRDDEEDEVVAASQVLDEATANLTVTQASLDGENHDDEEEEAGEDDEDDDDEDDDEDKEEPSVPFVVKVIDFAHTRLVDPKLGYDQGVDTGIDTVLRLLTTRIKQVKEKL